MFSDHKFRASEIKYLMTQPKTKKAKEAGELSLTCKRQLKKIYLKEVFGREEIISSKAMDRGTNQEDDSIDLLNKFLKKNFKKNQERLENDYITGEPDIITKDSVIDVKTRESLSTIFWRTPKQDEAEHKAQLIGYLWLTGKKEAYIANCLPDYPIEEIEKEFAKKSYFYPEEELQKIENQIIKNMSFGDLPLKNRVKIHQIEIDNLEKEIEDVKEKIKNCRNYLNAIYNNN